VRGRGSGGSGVTAGETPVTDVCFSLSLSRSPTLLVVFLSPSEVVNSLPPFSPFFSPPLQPRNKANVRAPWPAAKLLLARNVNLRCTASTLNGKRDNGRVDISSWIIIRISGSQQCIRYVLFPPVCLVRMETSVLREIYIIFRNRNGKLICTQFISVYVCIHVQDVNHYTLRRLIKVCVYDAKYRKIAI
jgi:hypothetical protein